MHAPVRFGEEVRLIGNCPALGNDDIDRAIVLVTSPAEYPFWSNREGEFNIQWSTISLVVHINILVLVRTYFYYYYFVFLAAIFLPEDTRKIKYRYCIFSGGKFVRYEAQGDEHIERLLRFVASNDGTNSTNDHLDVIPESDARYRRLSSRSSYDVGESDNIHRTRQFAETEKMKEKITDSDSVTVVSYFLPIILTKADGVWTADWNYEHILSFQTTLRVKWVGSVLPGKTVSIEDEERITQVLRPMNCYPIFVKPDQHELFYDVFCKQKLWPVLHHNLGVYDDSDDVSATSMDHSDKSLWYSYTTVNHQFRTKVVEVYNVGDLIWIHGFHLMLLPSFLRRRMQRAKIGLFMHTPFPSSEIWKSIWCREDLLRGMLAADQLGFHLYEYARHFLTTCRRLLGTHYEMSASGFLTIMSGGREVRLTCCHAGVDVYHIRNQVLKPSFLSDAIRWKSKFEGKVIVSTIDRLERLKGIPLQLIALEAFATQNPLWAEKVVFVIIGISAPERKDDYTATLRDVTSLVRVINKKFPNLIHFEEHPEKEMFLFNRLTLFSVSNVLMVSAPRDGLNRYPMEYTLARFFAGRIYCEEPQSAQEKATAALTGNTYVDLMSGNSLAEMLVGHTKPATSAETVGRAAEAGFEYDGGGAVICSQFVSCARVMRGAFPVNPWRGNDLISTLLRALELSPVEKGRRSRRNLEFCEKMSSFCWAENVLQDLKQTSKFVYDEDIADHSTLGLGINYRVTEFKSGFKVLDAVDLTRRYRLSKERLILLDWGGTLVSENDIGDKFEYYAVAKGHASRAGPSAEVKETLRLLCEDTRNTIFVITGKDLYALTDAFGDVNGLGLAAEHGCYFKWPRNVSGDKYTFKTRKKWQTMLNLGDVSWMDAVRQIMTIYVERTHGTYIEQKGSAIIFQFRDADPEFGYLQSKELQENLADVAMAYPIEIIRGGGLNDGYIEVRPNGLSKGLFLKHALSILASQGKSVDFVLGIGDDISDEPMFEAMHSINSLNGKCWSVTVGKKVSKAKAYVDDTNAVQELLLAMHKAAHRHSNDGQLDRKFFSAIDLTSSNIIRSDMRNSRKEELLTDVKNSPNKPGQRGISNFVQVRIATSTITRSSSDGRLARDRVHQNEQNAETEAKLFDFLKSSTVSPPNSPNSGGEEKNVNNDSMFNIAEEEDEEAIFF